eukprot:GHVO01022358.1.p1 GENE.GHVO01022358.1~~GHVO01022358.1.p1  ORF type:complete len:172 (+),score=47.48 GHVO01022358.1:583-1098(+)
MPPPRQRASVSCAVLPPKDEGSVMRWSRVLRGELKESSMSARRIALAILLASKIPKELDIEYRTVISDAGVTPKGRAWAEIGRDWDVSHKRSSVPKIDGRMVGPIVKWGASEAMRPIRLVTKRRLFEEHLEEDDDDVNENRETIQKILDERWGGELISNSVMALKLRQNMM